MAKINITPVHSLQTRAPFTPEVCDRLHERIRAGEITSFHMLTEALAHELRATDDALDTEGGNMPSIQLNWLAADLAIYHHMVEAWPTSLGRDPDHVNLVEVRAHADLVHDGRLPNS